jgi:hypothetical protein
VAERVCGAIGACVLLLQMPLLLLLLLLLGLQTVPTSTCLVGSDVGVLMALQGLWDAGLGLRQGQRWCRHCPLWFGRQLWQL